MRRKRWGMVCAVRCGQCAARGARALLVGGLALAMWDKPTMQRATRASTRTHSLRVRAMTACSLQWPLVGGAGMGAAAFAAMADRQVAIAGLAGISLEEYAACLGAQLVASVDVSGSGKSCTIPTCVGCCKTSPTHRNCALASWWWCRQCIPVQASAWPQSAAQQGAAFSHFLVGFPHRSVAHVEASVMRVVRELTGHPPPPHGRDAADGGGRRLARGDGARRRGCARSRAWRSSPTIVFEQPTPRAVARTCSSRRVHRLRQARR